MTEDTVTLKKSTLQLAAVFVVALVIGFVLGQFTAPKTTTGATTVTGTNPSQGSDNQPQAAQQGISPDARNMLDDDAIIGNKDAPVVVVEFSDFQCQFCRRFYTQTLPQLEQEYIQTGKVLFVYRDFPLSSIHPAAQKAAEAAECAEDQGKWREMHNAIFDEQNKLGAGTVDFNVEDIKRWAAGISGLNVNQFNECLDSGKYEQEVLADFQDGANAGVGGTPTFWVNGQQISGAQPYSVFKQVIDAELAKV
jgi:protein-disulfide isomerase